MFNQGKRYLAQENSYIKNNRAELKNHAPFEEKISYNLIIAKKKIQRILARKNIACTKILLSPPPPPPNGPFLGNLFWTSDLRSTVTTLRIHGFLLKRQIHKHYTFIKMFKGFIEPYPIHLVFGDQIISPKVKVETEQSCPMHRSLHRSHIKQAITSCSDFRKFCRVRN